MTPVSSMVTALGASEYAAGSQVWNGTTGTFTAKPRNAPKKMIRPIFFQPKAACNLVVSTPLFAMPASVMKSKQPGSVGVLVASQSARKLNSKATLPTMV